MAVLRDLLSIKAFREDRAEAAVRAQLGVLAAAAAECDKAQLRLDEFREWAMQRERELFEGLVARTVKLRDIEDVQLAMSDIRVKELDRVQSHEKAKDCRKSEQEALTTFKLAHAHASRIKQKFVELAGIHAAEELTDLERKEDAEMEEVAELRRDRTDWGLDDEDGA